MGQTVACPYSTLVCSRHSQWQLLSFQRLVDRLNAKELGVALPTDFSSPNSLKLWRIRLLTRVLPANRKTDNLVLVAFTSCDLQRQHSPYSFEGSHQSNIQLFREPNQRLNIGCCGHCFLRSSTMTIAAIALTRRRTTARSVHPADFEAMYRRSATGLSSTL